jgi:hypothetical protein
MILEINEFLLMWRFTEIKNCQKHFQIFMLKALNCKIPATIYEHPQSSKISRVGNILL